MNHNVLSMKIVALHKLPFDPVAYESDCESISGQESEQELRGQLRENWNNAWIIVVEWSGGPDDVDFGKFSHPNAQNQPTVLRQVPWLENILEEHQGVTRAGFFLHFVNQTYPVIYGELQLQFPEPTVPSAELLRAMPYSAP